MSDLFSRATAPTRTGDPETSFKAAEAVEPHTPTIRRQVAAFALQRGKDGLIDEELSKAFGDAEHSSYRTRRAELVEAGVVVDSGRRRNNSNGRECIVWVHRDFAEEKVKRVEPPCSPKPKPDAEVRTRGRAWAKKLDEFAAQMQSEGRRLFADELRECALTMRELSR